jgi:uncharacterized membrane protein YedE/YeeE
VERLQPAHRALALVSDFTPIASAIGGGLIGLSALALMLLHGRIAGISEIVGGLLRPQAGEMGWRLMFVLGLLAGGLVLGAVSPERFLVEVVRSPGAIVAAGLLVGFGTRLGSGCTSGHGVCGVSRVSRRSIAATVTFLGAGAATAALVTHLLGGWV